MRLILVPVADRPECTRALQVAFDLGHRLGASVSGCHIRPHRHSEVELSPGFPDAEWRRKSTKKAPESARALYREIAKANDYTVARKHKEAPAAYWSERVGSPEKVMAIVGSLADLIIVSRPSKPKSVADLFLQSALLEAGRPVLILPPRNNRKVGRKIVIAWDQGRLAAQAVTASLPLLAAANEVTIVSCGPENRAGPKSTQLVEYLQHWGIDAGRVTTRGRRVEAELLSAGKEVGADLIVAGAYSRSRWRERIFGGTTEYLVHKARVPVLVLHS